MSHFTTIKPYRTFVISYFEVALFPCLTCPPAPPNPSKTHPLVPLSNTSPLAVVIPLLMCEYQLGKRGREGECGQRITVSGPSVSTRQLDTQRVFAHSCLERRRKYWLTLNIHCFPKSSPSKTSSSDPIRGLQGGRESWRNRGTDFWQCLLTVRLASLKINKFFDDKEPI